MRQVAEQREEVCVTNNDMAEFEERHFDSVYPYGMFRRLTFYVDKEEQELHPLDLTEVTIQFYGGKVEAEVTDGVSHAVVQSDVSQERLERLKRARRRKEKKFHIVTERWVEACVDQGSLVDEKEFEL